MAVFTWVPDWNCAIERNPRVKVAAFGDGYEQRVAAGINSNLKRIPVTFSQLSQAEADAMLAFLDATGPGVTSFEFRLRDTDPLKKYRTDGAIRAEITEYGITVTATFQEVP